MPRSFAAWCRNEETEPKIQYHMNKSYKTIITAAAIAGLYMGALAAKSYGADAGAAAPAGQKAQDAKDSCKGKNDCKGKGGCGSSDNGCKGKNSCKGKGGCNTVAMGHSCAGKNDCKGKGGCKTTG